MHSVLHNISWQLQLIVTYKLEIKAIVKHAFLQTSQELSLYAAVGGGHMIAWSVEVILPRRGTLTYSTYSSLCRDAAAFLRCWFSIARVFSAALALDSWCSTNEASLRQWALILITALSYSTHPQQKTLDN